MDQFEQASRSLPVEAKLANLSDIIQNMANFAVFTQMISDEGEAEHEV